MVKKAKNRETSSKDKQVFWFFLIIILFMASIVLAPYIYHQIFNKFEYQGVAFEKIKDKQLVFYHGVFPIIVQGKLYHQYNMYFRTDPRDNNIPFNANMSLSKNVSISYEEEAYICKSAILGQSLLGQFFYAFPWVKKVNTALIDPELAISENISYVTCANATLDHTVFIFQTSENASIEEGDKENCYIINVGNCHNVEAAEKLVMGTIAQINEVNA
jgi:hypothetical protein